MTQEIKWTVDQTHTQIDFKVRHLLISNVKGSFKTFDGSIYTTGDDFTTAEIDFWIETASIQTGDEKRDEHLRGADFFDIENHKQISFKSNTISAADQDGKHELWGEFTMKGITKTIMLHVEFGGLMKDPYGNEKAGFTIEGKINRSDWGLVWNTSMEAGGLMVGDEVRISCEVELTNAGEREIVIDLKPIDHSKTTL